MGVLKPVKMAAVVAASFLLTGCGILFGAPDPTETGGEVDDASAAAQSAVAGAAGASGAASAPSAPAPPTGTSYQQLVGQPVYFVPGQTPEVFVEATADNARPILLTFYRSEPVLIDTGDPRDAQGDDAGDADETVAGESTTGESTTGESTSGQFPADDEGQEDGEDQEGGGNADADQSGSFEEDVPRFPPLSGDSDEDRRNVSIDRDFIDSMGEVLGGRLEQYRNPKLLFFDIKDGEQNYSEFVSQLRVQRTPAVYVMIPENYDSTADTDPPADSEGQGEGEGGQPEAVGGQYVLAGVITGARDPISMQRDLLQLLRPDVPPARTDERDPFRG